MSLRGIADVGPHRIDATAFVVAAWVSLVACGVRDYHLGGPEGPGVAGGARGDVQSGGAHHSRGGAPPDGVNVAGGTASGAGAGGSPAVRGSGGVGGTAFAGTGGIGGTTSGGIGGSAGLTGWASVSECGPRGTTGGDEGPTVRPLDARALEEAARASGPSIIEISGTMDLGDVVPAISSDKTLVGIDGAELVGSVRVQDARNVIVRNIRFNGGGVPGGRDALEVEGSSCVWVDHCEFFDGPDSNLDIVRASDLVTVSWSKFYYAAKNDEHRFGSVCGNDDTDAPGRINVTFHHNWWAERVLKDTPGARHGKVHLFNNYFSSAGNEYCIAARYMSKLLVENNFFEGVNDPIVFELDQDTAEVVETGNVYSGTSGDAVSRGSAFEPPYAYPLEAAEAARDRVVAEAGAR
jgi:pectate lyase